MSRSKSGGKACGSEINMRWMTLSILLLVVMAISVYLLFYRMHPGDEENKEPFFPKEAPLYL